jgi:hypothetical protein
MKTKVEIEGYEIEISFEEGMISVTAQKDDEVVEEFSINVEEEGQSDFEGGEEGEDIKGFGDYDEEEDFSGDDYEGQDEDEDDDDDDDAQDEAQDKREGAALESFQSFINKKK